MVVQRLGKTWSVLAACGVELRFRPWLGSQHFLVHMPHLKSRWRSSVWPEQKFTALVKTLKVRSCFHGLVPMGGMTALHRTRLSARHLVALGGTERSLPGLDP